MSKKEGKYLNGLVVLVLSALISSGFPVCAKQGENIDTTDINKGIVHVHYKGSANKRLKVIIQKGDEKYTYNLDGTGKVERFPLQMGNGAYKVSIFENTEGTKYRLVTSQTINLEMENPNDVYLNSIQNIEWNADMAAILNAKDMVKSLTEANQKINTLYEHMVWQYQYDYDKLATLPTTYLPFIDETYQEKIGICYDFSALYASMLRSQGIPVKLVKGYTPNAEGYHAWNEVYNAKTKKWMIIDSTYDLQVIRHNKDIKQEKSSKDYQKVNEY